jgi:hypothetical protein
LILIFIRFYSLLYFKIIFTITLHCVVCLYFAIFLFTIFESYYKLLLNL